MTNMVLHLVDKRVDWEGGIGSVDLPRLQALTMIPPDADAPSPFANTGPFLDNLYMQTLPGSISQPYALSVRRTSVPFATLALHMLAQDSLTAAQLECPFTTSRPGIRHNICQWCHSRLPC